MIETITNLKNNRLKQQNVMVNIESILKMKKFLNNLGKKIQGIVVLFENKHYFLYFFKNIFYLIVQATEALRVSLDDIRFVETKGMNYLAANLVKRTYIKFI